MDSSGSVTSNSAGKLSFKLKSTTSSLGRGIINKNNSNNRADGDLNELSNKEVSGNFDNVDGSSQHKVEFLSSFDGTTTHNMDKEAHETKQQIVIPLQKYNAWQNPTQPISTPNVQNPESHEHALPRKELSAEERLRRAVGTKKKQLKMEDASEGLNIEGKEDPHDIKAKPERFLEQRAIEAILASKEDFKEDEIDAIPLLMRNRAPGTDKVEQDDDKFRIDVAQRPEECSLEDYKRVPVSQFGAAMLRGMGWKEGEAIGGTVKGIVEPIEYVPRMNRLGLGATRDLELKPDYKHIHKKYIKPGESRNEVTHASAKVDASGKAKNIKLASEKLYDAEIVKLQRNARVFIIAGAHEGHVGTVKRLHNLLVDVQLALSGTIITLDESKVEPVTIAAYKERLSIIHSHGISAVLKKQKKPFKSNSDSGNPQKISRKKEAEKDNTHQSKRPKYHSRGIQKVFLLYRTNYQITCSISFALDCFLAHTPFFI